MEPTQCKKCGHEVSPDDRYCRKCGTSVTGRSNIIEIARYQRGLLFVILFRFPMELAAILGLVPPNNISMIIFALIGLVLLVAILFMIIQLLGAMSYGFITVLLCVILVFFPMIGLITLLVINGRATKILREAGLKVGFMGVNPNDLHNDLHPVQDN